MVFYPAPLTDRASHPILVQEIPKVYRIAQATNHEYETVGHNDDDETHPRNA